MMVAAHQLLLFSPRLVIFPHWLFSLFHEQCYSAISFTQSQVGKCSVDYVFLAFVNLDWQDPGFVRAERDLIAEIS